jgi:hypothetical protein
MCNFDSATNMYGDRMRLLAAVTASEHCPLRSASTAEYMATKLDEHAVSIQTDGPCQSKKYDIRLAVIEVAVPGAQYCGMASMSRLVIEA